MDPIYENTGRRRSIAVSSYGGQARQFRVQVLCPSSGQWQRWATYSDQHLADKCARECEQDGHEVRVITFAITPAAA